MRYSVLHLVSPNVDSANLLQMQYRVLYLSPQIGVILPEIDTVLYLALEHNFSLHAWVVYHFCPDFVKIFDHYANARTLADLELLCMLYILHVNAENISHCLASLTWNDLQVHLQLCQFNQQKYIQSAYRRHTASRKTTKGLHHDGRKRTDLKHMAYSLFSGTHSKLYWTMLQRLFPLINTNSMLSFKSTQTYNAI